MHRCLHTQTHKLQMQSFLPKKNYTNKNTIKFFFNRFQYAIPERCIFAQKQKYGKDLKIKRKKNTSDISVCTHLFSGMDFICNYKYDVEVHFSTILRLPEEKKNMNKLKRKRKKREKWTFSVCRKHKR